MNTRRRSPNEPERRDRIAEATLVLIEKVGVARTTYRRIAETANVPLGSVTYYFADLDELLAEAFKIFVTRLSARFEGIMAATLDRKNAEKALAAFIVNSSKGTQTDLILSLELYAYALRRPERRSIMLDWMAASRRALERHFTAPQAKALDALIEGVTLHNTTHPDLLERTDVEQMIRAITT
ncbi:TetR/AcrR family transcriptional regulator [Gluconobacter cerinus]